MAGPMGCSRTTRVALLKPVQEITPEIQGAGAAAVPKEAGWGAAACGGELRWEHQLQKVELGLTAHGLPIDGVSAAHAAAVRWKKKKNSF